MARGYHVLVEIYRNDFGNTLIFHCHPKQRIGKLHRFFVVGNHDNLGFLTGLPFRAFTSTAEDLPLISELDNAGQTERAAGPVLDNTLPPHVITFRHKNALVNAEPGMLPLTHVAAKLRRNFFLLYQFIFNNFA